MAKDNLTVHRLKQVLHYNEATGCFHWIAKASKKTIIGAIAGFSHVGGYWRMRIDGVDYLAHRLAWFYATGAWPLQNIDHKDGNRLNNSFNNLRDVPQSINVENKRCATKRSKTGLLGVRKHRNRFEARIMLAQKEIGLGGYATPEEASAAYLAAKRLLHAGCMI